MSKEASWSVVGTYGTVYQAEIAVAVLKGSGIPAHVRSEQAGVFGPGYMGGVTHGASVLVPSDAAEEAQRILSEEGGAEPAWAPNEEE